MSHRSRLLAAVCGAALSMPVTGLVAPVWAQDTRGVQALLDQANYWRLQNRPELVVRTLERVLAVDPRNADALAGAALAQAQSGNRAAAESYLARLRQVAPNDPRVAETDINVRAATVDQGALAEARRLAQAGRTAEAIARYRELFRGNQPPDAYAVEFYQTLAGTEAGFGEAQAGLQRLSGRFPQDQRLQLALAQTLTFRDGTRADGITRLRQLAQNPEVANAAVAAWRQALIWQGNNPAVVPELEAFLQRFPNDQAIAQRLEEVRNAPASRPDPAAEGRIRAFEALNAGRLADSRRDFESAIAANPNDSDALGGLGVVRLREGRFAEARTLLERAIAANPDSRQQWQQALSGASYAADLATARGALARGDLNTAETALRRAIASNAPDRADAEALLGDLALRRGDLAGAEQRYRAALARRPNLGAAASGLFEVLNQQGRFAEAEALRPRIPTGGGNPGEERANALRAEAQRTNDPNQAAALLAEAIRSDPTNPWARLDLARMYARMGRGAEGRQIVEGSGVSTPDQLFAAALFANEDNRPEDVQRYLSGIPVRLRTADMNRLLTASRTDAEARQAVGLYRSGRRAEGRAALVALAGRPDPTGATASSAIRTLGLVNDRAGAAEAGRAFVNANANSGAQARLAVAGALLSAGATAEATALSRSVEGARGLTPEDQRQAAALSTGLAIQTSDRLNERGQQAAAFDVLAPALQRDPGSVPANLALARLYQGAGQPTQARQITEGILQRDPRSLDARIGAIEAAVAARDFSRAEALLVEARALNPNDPRVSLLEARIARASGNSGRALRALELAAEQRRAQGIVADAPGTGIAGTTADGAFDNPFRRVSRAGALGGSSLVQTDPISGEIARELSQVREETASRLQGGIGFRSRTGTNGLDRLEEYSAPIDFSTGVPGAGGRATFSVSPVAITSGRLDSSSAALLRTYGTNALAQDLRQSTFNQSTQLTQLVRDRYAPRDTSVQGVGLGLAYTRGAFAADIGTSPIGFRRQNVLGGIEIAPAITQNFRVRLILEQRSVTDSLLSWSGARDPNSDRSWGGVVRAGGRGQAEYVSGPVAVYMLGGYSAFTGQNVRRNNRFEAGAGAQYTVWRLPDEELTIGTDLVYFGYENNQRLFTFGNGGYFSPQSYFAVNIPVDWRARSGNLSWRLGGTVGYQSFRENAAPFFPRDPALQQQLEQQLSSDPTARSIQAARSEAGVIGGVRADIEYAISPNLRVGGLLRYDRTANWEEVRGLAFARYRFDR